MSTITVSKKSLLRQVGKQMAETELKEKIVSLGVSVESIKDDELILEINPNRPDLLSEQGLGRALTSLLGIKKGIRKYAVKTGGAEAKVIIDKSIDKVRPYTACAIVKNLKFDDGKIKEIIQVQEKLHVSFGRNRKRVAIGIYPLEHIKLPIHYKALKPEEIVFQPLEANKPMNGRQILEQHPSGRAYAHLLQGLDKYPVFMDSNKEILSMPPIINSEKTGKVSEKTTEVFIECSGFDFRIMEQCLNLLVCVLADMGGIIYSMELDYPEKKRITPNLEPEKMKVNMKYINKILGLELKENELKLCLEKMGYEYDLAKKTAFIPAYRTDIIHMIDLAEDAGIAYGYDNIPEIIPKVATIGKENEMSVLCERMREILIGHGLIELKSYYLVNKEDQAKKCNPALEEELIEIKNSQAEGRNSMRAWLIPSILATLGENKHREYPQNVFEIGEVFKVKPENETGCEEETSLAVALSDEEVDYTKIKQITDSLFKTLNLEVEVAETQHLSFIKGRAGKITAEHKELGFIGELAPEVLSNFNVIMPVSCFEININKIFDLMKKER
jgi:phenylalanyl-tRNA synthetase beta chain